MNDSPLHPLARDYLKRLKKAARRLPRARRKELIGEIESHLSEALPAGASEAEALSVLERLGEPEQIVAEAESGSGERAGIREWLAIPFLLIGGFIFLVGWFVGVALLWSSKVWTTRDKVIGTFFVPGGLAALVLVVWINLMSIGHGSHTDPVTCVTNAGGATCTGGTASHSGPYDLRTWALTMVLITLPFFTASYLARRANEARLQND